MKQLPKYSSGEIIVISEAEGFKKAKMVLIERPYLYTEDYVTHFGDKIINSVSNEEQSVYGSYAIVFGDYRGRVGKLVSQEELAGYKIHLMALSTRPGILHYQNEKLYLIKQMDKEFFFIDESGKTNVGQSGHYLVAIPEEEDFRIFDQMMFKLNFKIMEKTND